MKNINFSIFVTTRDEDSDKTNLEWSLNDHYYHINIPEIVSPIEKLIKYNNNGVNKDYIRLLRRKYGFSVYENFITVNYGICEYDSSIDQSKSFNLGWRDHTFVRWSIYDTNQCLYGHCELKGLKKWNSDEVVDMRAGVTKLYFSFNDFDGEEIIATCLIEEREWHIGSGWFSWLHYFNKPLIRRCIDISFNKGTGSRKGSWKGGTLGTGIEMQPGEAISSAFLRYAKEHNFTNIREL
ncbi:hypothetical protein M0R04_06835 [Candidatus Dojkabacteria bacterium]|jgi:hypothetical protein|nr:hypothetical protein [Candidatus Dojkabacteria bacterium]